MAPSDSDKSAYAHWDVGETLADRFRAHARDSRHLYGYAMRGMAEDWEAGGPTRIACREHENAPRGAMIQLRLLAGVFRLVLAGEAPELVGFYPCLGGREPARHAWPVMREVIAAHIDEVHAALAVAPQTTEVGRSAALLAGLFDLVATSGMRRIRLLELGASAGLNLLLDQYAFRANSWHFGPSDSKVLIADDELFHEKLVGLSHNDELVHALRAVNARIHFIRWSGTSAQARAREFYKEHLSLLDSIQKRDKEGSLEKLRKLIAKTRDEISMLLKDGAAQVYIK